MSSPFRWIVRLMLACALAVGLGFMPYRTMGPGGIRRVLQLERDLARIIRENQRIAGDNRLLLQQIRSLRRSPQALERVARDELGLVRPHDLVFQFE